MRKPWITPLSDTRAHNVGCAAFSQRRPGAIWGSSEDTEGNRSKKKASSAEAVQLPPPRLLEEMGTDFEKG